MTLGIWESVETRRRESVEGRFESAVGNRSWCVTRRFGVRCALGSLGALRNLVFLFASAIEKTMTAAFVFIINLLRL